MGIELSKYLSDARFFTASSRPRREFASSSTQAESTEYGASPRPNLQIAVDDFGTGYSRLSCLRKFPIDSLNIDQTFVSQVTSAPRDTSIVIDVISMGRSLKLQVVADGVETQNEVVFLQAHQRDEA